MLNDGPLIGGQTSVLGNLKRSALFPSFLEGFDTGLGEAGRGVEIAVTRCPT